VSDHRARYPWAFPPEDWQESHPGETWSQWYRREHGQTYANLLSPCCSWPMEDWRCLNPQHVEAAV
jgi:hypothetical protein